MYVNSHKQIYLMIKDDISIILSKLLRSLVEVIECFHIFTDLIHLLLRNDRINGFLRSELRIKV